MIGHIRLKTQFVKITKKDEEDEIANEKYWTHDRFFPSGV